MFPTMRSIFDDHIERPVFHAEVDEILNVRLVDDLDLYSLGLEAKDIGVDVGANHQSAPEIRFPHLD